jgi:hypothetical protein
MSGLGTLTVGARGTGGKVGRSARGGAVAAVGAGGAGFDGTGLGARGVDGGSIPRTSGSTPICVGVNISSITTPHGPPATRDTTRPITLPSIRSITCDGSQPPRGSLSTPGGRTLYSPSNTGPLCCFAGCGG